MPNAVELLFARAHPFDNTCVYMCIKMPTFNIWHVISFERHSENYRNNSFEGFCWHLAMNLSCNCKLLCCVFHISHIVCIYYETNIKIATQVRREGQLTCLTNNFFGFYRWNLRKNYFFTLGQFGKVMRKSEPLVAYYKYCY